MIKTTVPTDDTLRETADHGNARYPFAYYFENIYDFDFHCVNWHWHHEVEFVYVQKGSSTCFLDSEKVNLPEGFGMFINSGILHRFETSVTDMIFPNIVFSPDLLAPEGSLVYEKYIEPVIHSTVPYQVFNPHVAWQNQILIRLKKVFKLQEANSPSEISTLQLLIELWNIMESKLDLSSVVESNKRLNVQQAKLHIMMEYVQDNYSKEITLDDIADSASVSKSSALHIFKSGIHISPVDYLIQYRLSQAAEQLCQTEKSVTSISDDTGFHSAAYFCRKFKQYYNMTPFEYKQSK